MALFLVGTVSLAVGVLRTVMQILLDNNHRSQGLSQNGALLF